MPRVLEKNKNDGNYPFHLFLMLLFRLSLIKDALTPFSPRPSASWQRQLLATSLERTKGSSPRQHHDTWDSSEEGEIGEASFVQISHVSTGALRPSPFQKSDEIGAGSCRSLQFSNCDKRKASVKAAALGRNHVR